MKYCINCGTKLPEGARFCPECGHSTNLRVENVPPSITSSTSSINTSIPDEEPEFTINSTALQGFTTPIDTNTPAQEVEPTYRNSSFLSSGLFRWLLIIIVVVGGWEIYRLYAWDIGINAYNRQECQPTLQLLPVLTQGIPTLRIAEQMSYLKDNDVERVVEECRMFTKAEDTALEGQYGLAAAYLIDLLIKFPNSMLTQSAIQQRFQWYLNSTALTRFAQVELCNHLIMGDGEELFTSVRDLKPKLLYQCGQTFNERNAWEQSIYTFNLFLSRYPNRPEATEVKNKLVEAEFIYADSIGATVIEQPTSTYVVSTDKSVYKVTNNSPGQVRVILSNVSDGEAIIRDIESCLQCVEYSVGESPQVCTGPTVQIDVPPGRYRVLVKIIDTTSIIPYKGSWSFGAGVGYSGCYYIESR